MDPAADPVYAHYAREAALIAGELAADEPGRWWFRVDRSYAGAVWDRLCPAFHAVAAWNLHLVEPRFARRHLGT